jgi:hypothetical protein
MDAVRAPLTSYLWASFGRPFGPPSGALWAPFGPLGALWAPFGRPLGALGALWVSFGRPLAAQGTLTGKGNGVTFTFGRPWRPWSSFDRPLGAL